MRTTVTLLAFAAAACGGGRPAATPATPGKPATDPVAEPAAPTASAPARPVSNQSLAALGLDPTALDRAADPCDDFYQFACGGWIKRTEIPADKPLAMRSFIAIDDANRDYVHDLLERLRSAGGTTPSEKQLAAYYGSCMNEPAIAQAGTTALRPTLAVIDKIKDTRSLSAAIATLHASGIPALFALSPTQDSADARNVIAGIDQAGLGLPDRDFYLNDDEPSRALRTTYQTTVEKLLTLLGHTAAKREAQEVLALETEIAKISLDKVARRDPKATYNKIDRAGVAKAMPAFDWDNLWTTAGLAAIKDVTVASPAFLAGLDALLRTTPPARWRPYLATHVALAAADSLPKPFEDAVFALRSSLTGQPEQAPRWRRCVDATGQALTDLIGQAFVRDRFAGASKPVVEDLLRAIVAAMARNLDALPWMDPATRAKAKDKLAAMTYQFGFPRNWKTYDFKLDPRTWTANVLTARKARRARQLAKIGKTTDKDEWQMSAADVDAYYDAQVNGMVFPAGILQPPFFSASASLAANFGGIGMVIGHEITHGFDDQGAQYDAVGNLVNWWQPDTEHAFKQRTGCVIDQYARYEVAGGTKLNGGNTVGENIADIGGVKLALSAYRAVRAGAPETIIADGFTEDQQFFLGFGQAWCAKMRPDFEKLMTTVDVHAPAKWRVNGSLAATPEFATAFRCKAGAKMVPAKQCAVW